MTQHCKVPIEMKISLYLPKEPDMRFTLSCLLLILSPFDPSRSDNVVLVLRRTSP